METVTLGGTFRLIRSDFRRMSELMGMGKSLGRRIFLAMTPSIVGLTIYRLSHWCYVKHLRFLAWPMWLANTYLTGLDIVPSAVVGHSCFIGHPVGSVITGKLGDKVMMFGSVLIGGGLGHGDVGAGDGLPVIGNDVIIGIRATILGPITIGDGAMIGACAMVVTDIAAGAAVGNRPSRPIAGGRIDYEAIAGLKDAEAKSPVPEPVNVSPEKEREAVL